MRNYIGSIKKSDVNEYLKYSNKAGALADLAATLNNLSIPDEYIGDISPGTVETELSELKEKKQAKFMEIFNKYGWDKHYAPEQVFIYDSGKAYAASTPQDFDTVDDRVLKSRRFV